MVLVVSILYVTLSLASDSPLSLSVGRPYNQKQQPMPRANGYAVVRLPGCEESRNTRRVASCWSG